jgi:SnoaL-like domain
MPEHSDAHELAHRYLDAVLTADPKRVVELYDDSATIEVGNTAVSGARAIEAFFRDMWIEVTALRGTVGRAVSSNDVLMFEWTSEADTRGGTHCARGVDVQGYRNGKILRATVYVSSPT